MDTIPHRKQDLKQTSISIGTGIIAGHQRGLRRALAILEQARREVGDERAAEVAAERIEAEIAE